MIPNPNGANGTTSDPREQVCWDYYVKSIENNQTNAYQSALNAGYEESSAIKITTRDWFVARLQKLKRKDMLSKAERNLDKVLDFEMQDQEGKVNVSVASLVTNVSTTVVKTLGKDDGYSERKELTGADGKDLVVQIVNYADTTQLPAESLPVAVTESTGQGDQEGNNNVE